MDRVKFILVLVISVAVLGLGGWWAINTMQSSSDYVKNQKIKKLEAENEELKLMAEKLKTEADLSENNNVAEKPIAEPAPQTKPSTTPKPITPKPTSTTYKNQTLINELQKLANAGTILKLKTASPAVGSVQKFLNLYNKTSNKIDNDYGATTKTKVAAFQKAQGLTASGEAGKATFTKMVAWLKKQG